MSMVTRKPDIEIMLDMEAMTVSTGDTAFTFAIPESYRQSLISGSWDTTSALLANKDLIEKKIAELPYIAGY
jgi:3-isopropylmalate dehydratase small subunit